MSVIKCKMCGGDLQIVAGSSVAECEYCGTKQTVPNVDNEKKVALFTRANRLRANCEFDKAEAVYESIASEFPEEAEAFWGLVLCKYGIEYVDDPASGKKIPTCHRSSFESVMDDTNFEMALEYADADARKVYRDEAKVIEEIRKGIIEVSGKEEPYDIFICYKETDEKGNRTLDSVIAQDIYNELVAKGYRVFFSRITLEDKLGQEYEPFIFAALNSAKVMLAVGTDYEYYNAVWVKNEWSRYLKLIASGQKKTLIPCYKNIDAYDMPKEFAKLQAQDMGKVGAMQDLLRGVEKILTEIKIVPSTPEVVNTLEELLADKKKRERIEKERKKLAFAILIVALIASAGIVAYKPVMTHFVAPLKVYKQAERALHQEEYLLAADIWGQIPNFYNSSDKIRECLYLHAISLKNAHDYLSAAQAFEGMDPAYEDVLAQVDECYYWYAMQLKEQEKYKDAAEAFRNVSNNYQDSAEQVLECQYLYAEKINSQLMKQGVDVASLYKELGEYKDSKEKYSSILYERAVKYMESDTLATKTKAFGLLNEISTYKDSADRVQSLLYELYSGAVNAFNQKKFDEAKETFAILKEHSYKDSADRYAECDPAKAAEESRIQAEREAEVARKKAEAEAEAARKAAEAQKIAEEKNKIVGTWYSSNAWPWGVTIRFTQSGMMQYKLGDDKDWSRQESFTYNTSTGKYGFKWVSHSYTATLSGNKLTVKGNDADAPFFVGSYSRIS